MLLRLPTTHAPPPYHAHQHAAGQHFTMAGCRGRLQRRHAAVEDAPVELVVDNDDAPSTSGSSVHVLPPHGASVEVMHWRQHTIAWCWRAYQHTVYVTLSRHHVALRTKQSCRRCFSHTTTASAISLIVCMPLCCALFQAFNPPHHCRRCIHQPVATTPPCATPSSVTTCLHHDALHRFATWSSSLQRARASTQPSTTSAWPSRPTRSPPSWGRQGLARRRCCAWWRGWNTQPAGRCCSTGRT